MKPLFIILTLATLLTLTNCKKNNSPGKSSSKSITFFIFKAADNPGVLYLELYGAIGPDTIQVNVKQGISLTSLVPSITYVGAAISPKSNTAQDFSHPVTYTVTAEDGSTKNYVVVARVLSDAKGITSFTFRAANNAALTADITGAITGDTITLFTNPGVDPANLIPTIVYTGKTLSPATGNGQDFNSPVFYAVSAEDGSTKLYTVFVSSNQTVYAGSYDSYLYAINAASGALRWKTATGGIINSSPTLYNGMVFAGNNDGYLYAFDAQTGAIKWKLYTNGVITSSPVIANGLLYVNSQGGYLYCLDPATANQKWKYNLNIPSGDASPTVSNGTVYIANGGVGTAIYALDALTGTQKWINSLGISVSNPAVYKGVLYAGGEWAKLAALDTATGAIKWAYNDHAYGSPTGPAISNDVAFIAGYDNYMYAFDVTTGSVKWRYGTGAFSSPVISNGVLYTGNGGSYLYAMDAAAGTVLWQYRTSGSNTVSGVCNPTVANDVVYIGAMDNYFYAINAKTGVMKWRFPTNGSIYAGPCVIDSRGNVFHPGVSGEQN